MDCSPPGSSVHGISQARIPIPKGMGCHSLLQGIFLTQRLNPGLLHYRHMLYHLSHQGSPYTVESYAVVKHNVNAWQFSCFHGSGRNKNRRNIPISNGLRSAGIPMPHDASYKAPQNVGGAACTRVCHTNSACRELISATQQQGMMLPGPQSRGQTESQGRVHSLKPQHTG